MKTIPPLAGGGVELACHRLDWSLPAVPFGRKIALGAFLSLVVMAALTVVIDKNARRRDEGARQAVDVELCDILLLTEAQGSFLVAEAAVGRHLASGDEKDLGVFREASAAIQESLRALQKVIDEKDEPNALAAIVGHVKEWTETAAEPAIIASRSRRGGGKVATDAAPSAGEAGRRIADSAHELLEQLGREQETQSRTILAGILRDETSLSRLNPLHRAGRRNAPAMSRKRAL